MGDANSLFSDGDRERIATAVASAETQTAAEIVCAVASESGRYDRAEGICGIVTAVFSLAVANFVLLSDFSGAESTGDGVSHGWSDPVGLGLLGQVMAVCVGYVLGNLLGSYCHPLRRFFVLQREMDEEVARSASRVFLSQRVSATRCAGGVLVYVSLFERSVVVLADDGVMQHDGQSLVEAARDRAENALRAGKWVDAFADAVGEIAERLRQTLPAAGEDVDELQNALRVFHPRP
ncbi:MAG: hypothetical protein CMJ59_21275 [Planctomycetaceae bacterium]|nr:hypothetical protein [Planctomycetaceae bacterium]